MQAMASYSLGSRDLSSLGAFAVNESMIYLYGIAQNLTNEIIVFTFTSSPTPSILSITNLTNLNYV